MHVVAALDAEREAVAERRWRDRRRPGPERDHRVGGLQRPVGGRHRPAVADGARRARVAGDEPAAARDEQVGVGLRQRLRVGRRQRIGEMDAAARRRRRDAARARASSSRSSVDRRTPNGFTSSTSASARSSPRVGAQGLDPAALAQQRAGARPARRGRDARRRCGRPARASPSPSPRRRPARRRGNSARSTGAIAGSAA